MTIVNVDIPDALKVRLESEAERAMRTQRAVLILALEAYLYEREQTLEERASMVSTSGESKTPDALK